MKICQERENGSAAIAMRVVDYMHGVYIMDELAYSTDRRISELLGIEIRRTRYVLHHLWTTKTLERATLRSGERMYRLAR